MRSEAEIREMHDKLEDRFRWILEGGVTPPDVSVGACKGLGWALELTCRSRIVSRGSPGQDTRGLGKAAAAAEGLAAMKGFYYQFARIALRLLINIYWNQVKTGMVGGPRPQDIPEIADAHAWLEAHK